MSFQINNAVFADYIGSLNFTFTPSTLRLIGIRGVDLNDDGSISLNGNAPNLYNDLVGCWGNEFQLWQATVDPGIAESPNPLGMAHLAGLEDQGRPYKFVHGTHKGQYPCLVQGEDVIVHRPRKDPDVGQFAIEIHHGGTANEVDNWSEGCQVIRNDSGEWNEFWTMVQSSGQDEFTYFLIDGEALAQHTGALVAQS